MADRLLNFIRLVLPNPRRQTPTNDGAVDDIFDPDALPFVPTSWILASTCEEGREQAGRSARGQVRLLRESPCGASRMTHPMNIPDAYDPR